MNKAANIYWDDTAGYQASRRNATVKRRRPSPVKTKRRTAPWWLSFLIVTSIFTMLLVSINFRAFTEMQEEAARHSQLGVQIQSLMDENLALQEEIHALRTDPNVIKREAKRIGIALQTQVSVPSN